MKYPVERKLLNYNAWVCRDGTWKNVDVVDLTEHELRVWIQTIDIIYLKEIFIQMALTFQRFGDQFGVNDPSEQNIPPIYMTPKVDENGNVSLQQEKNE